jgi:hypothetical protein
VGIYIVHSKNTAHTFQNVDFVRMIIDIKLRYSDIQTFENKKIMSFASEVLYICSSHIKR